MNKNWPTYIDTIGENQVVVNVIGPQSLVTMSLASVDRNRIALLSWVHVVDLADRPSADAATLDFRDVVNMEPGRARAV
jgi:hypothetical protein